MASVDKHFVRNVRKMENVIFVCFGKDDNSYLPQIGDEEDAIIGLVHGCTGKPLELIGCEIHHQTDPSYQ